MNLEPTFNGLLTALKTREDWAIMSDTLLSRDSLLTILESLEKTNGG